MMGEMAAEFTGLSVLKVLMCSSDVESNSCGESRGNGSAEEFGTRAQTLRLLAANQTGTDT